MPKGEHLKKYDNPSPKKVVISFRLDVEDKNKFFELFKNLPEILRAFIKNEISKSSLSNTWFSKIISLEIELDDYEKLCELTDNPSALIRALIKRYLWNNKK